MYVGHLLVRAPLARRERRRARLGLRRRPGLRADAPRLRADRPHRARAADPLPLAKAAAEHRELEPTRSPASPSSRRRPSTGTSSGAGSPAFARPNPDHPHRAVVASPKPRARWPQVTVIVPTKDAPQHLAALPRIDLLAIDVPELRRAARRQRDDRPDGAARSSSATRSTCSRSTSRSTSRASTTLGVAHASGELVVFLNNDTEVQTPEWLEAMVSLAERDGVGAVGAAAPLPERHASSTPASCSGCAARPTTSCAASRAAPTATPARSPARGRCRR